MSHLFTFWETVELVVEACYTCDKQMLWEGAGAFFRATTLVSARKSGISQFRRSWSGGKMLAFQPKGFVIEPVRMR